MPENMLCGSVKQEWHEEFQACKKVPDTEFITLPVKTP